MLFLICICFAIWLASVRNWWRRKQSVRERQEAWEQSSKEALAWAKEQDEKMAIWKRDVYPILKAEEEEKERRKRTSRTVTHVHIHKHEHLHVDHADELTVKQELHLHGKK